MNIILVNHYAGGKRFGMEFRPYYMAKEWIRMGHKVLIVAASYSHVRAVQPIANSAYLRETVDGIDYLWIKTNTYHGNGIGRIFSMLAFTVKLFFLAKHVRNFNPSLIISSSTYTIESFPLVRLARRLKTKYCYEVHDLWPLSPIEFGGYSKWHPFIRIMQWGEDWAYKHSDFVVSLLPAAKSYMISRGLKSEKFNYIPNGIDIAEWDETDINLPKSHIELFKHLKTRKKFLIGYAGSHGLANSLEHLIAAATMLDDSVAIVLIGKGPEKKRLEEKVKRESITNVYFLDPISKNKIPACLAFFDGLYIGLQKQSLLRFGMSPNKIFDYMMAEKPIIQAIDAGNNLVRDYNCGIDVEPENGKSIAAGILKLKGLSPEERLQLGKNGKEAVLRYHNFTVLCKQFIDIASKNN